MKHSEWRLQPRHVNPRIQVLTSFLHCLLPSVSKYACILRWTKCNCLTDKYHGTYHRKIQDLPILGKSVQLEICSREYECVNDNCEVTSFAETFDGFVNTYSRMTERCADFICTLALETSCEGCARICRTLGIKTSGDTVIHSENGLSITKISRLLHVTGQAHMRK